MNGKKMLALFSAICMMAISFHGNAVSAAVVNTPTVVDTSIVNGEAEDFLATAKDMKYAEIFDGSTKAKSFNMNGRTYYQGIAMNGEHYSQDSEVNYNVEKVNSISFTIGHMDNTGGYNAKMSVYLDNVIYEEITLYRTMPLKEYSIDVSDVKHLRIFIDREGSSGYGFGDVKVDSSKPVLSNSIPSYDTAEKFISSSFNNSYMETYDGSTKAKSFNMNGRTYYQGIVMNGDHYSQDSEVNYNVEKVNSISFTIGHMDNTGGYNAKMSVYLDDVIYEEITLYRTMPLKEYSIDVSDVKHLRIFIDREGSSGYSFGDVKVDSGKPVLTNSIPSYDTAEKFISSSFNNSYMETYDGSTKAKSFNMNGRTYYQGIVMNGEHYSQDSEVNYNVEIVNSISFTIGHMDNTGGYNAKMSVYLDDVIYDEITLYRTMPLKEYNIDVSDVKHLRIFIDREGSSGYGFGDVKVDSKDPVSKHIIPSYGTNIDFMKSTFDSKYYEIYDGASPKVYNFTMNGKVYDKAIILNGNHYSFDSELNFNVEKLDKIKFRIGHIEGKGNAAARLSIKKDNVLHETIDLTSGMNYIDYTLDVRGVERIQIICDRDGESGYALANVDIESVTTTTTITTTSTTKTTTTTTKSSSTTTKASTTTSQKTSDVIFGDINCDGSVNSTDYMLISLYLEDKTAVVITDQGLANADVYYPGSGITKHDADTLQKWITGKLSSLPVYESEKNQGQNMASLYGDSNCDNNVDVSDAVLIMQSLSNPSKFQLTEQGKANADCCNVGDGVTNADALAIQKYKLSLINSLPID